MKSTLLGRISILLVLAALAWLAFHSPYVGELNFNSLKNKERVLKEFYRFHPLRTVGLYFLLYSLTTILCIPASAILSLAGGLIFGLWPGALFVPLASTTGATLSFLIARFLLRDWIQNRFRQSLEAINRGMKKDGAFYLLTLRLMAFVPFFLINMAMGLTPIRILPYAALTFLGGLPVGLLLVNAGRQLSRINSPQEIFSFKLWLSFSLLAIFPIFLRWLISSKRPNPIPEGPPAPVDLDKSLKPKLE